jgi:hypothetical protein
LLGFGAMKSPLLLSLLAVPSLAFTLWACGGKEATVDRSGSTEGAQTAGTGDPATGTGAGTGSGTTSGKKTTPAAPAPECTHSGQSGSGGGGGPNGEYSCLTGHHYECSGGERSVSCECKGVGGSWGPTGTCTCSDTGVTFDYDCTNACSPLPAEVFAKCNLPVPPPEPAGTPGGSTSSSSGG